jgi:P2X purinoceptor 1
MIISNGTYQPKTEFFKLTFFIFDTIIGWCPAEDDQGPPMLIKEVLNFTLFIKNFIEFPEFNVKHKNMVDELKPCVFHPKDDKDCPIFGIEYIINQAEKDLVERDLMLRFGGVISVKLEWDCNLDRSIKLCKPKYSFQRLDVPFRDKPFSVGFNFRHSSNWKYNGTSFRTLSKAFGLRLIIAVSGKAGKFDFITLTLNTGSLVGIFGLATFICDIVLLHISKQANTYRNHVFETVHTGTRSDSILRSRPRKSLLQNDYEHSNSNNSNGDITTIKKSTGKTVVTRPLTVMNLDQLKLSDTI